MRQFFKIFIPILLLLLLGYAIFHIYNQQKEVKKNTELVAKYKQELQYEQTDKARLNKDLQVVAEQNIVLLDSVKILKKRIVKLNEALKNKVIVIEENKGEIARLQQKMNGLLAQINTLNKEKNSLDAAKFKELDQARFELNQQIGDLFMQNQKLEEENGNLLAEIVKKEKEKDNVQGQLEVTENELRGATGKGNYEVEGKKGIYLNINAIEADFSTAQALTRRNKPARSVKKWETTKIKFNLIYPKIEDLLNQNFSLQLYNEDTGEVLSPRESNEGAYDAKGIEFAFTGNPVKVNFVNYEAKKDLGTNYTVRLYFLDAKGKEISLASAVSPVKFKR